MEMREIEIGGEDAEPRKMRKFAGSLCLPRTYHTHPQKEEERKRKREKSYGIFSSSFFNERLCNRSFVQAGKEEEIEQDISPLFHR